MHLVDWINKYAEDHCNGDVKLADERLAIRFGVKPRTIESWRLGQRRPSTETSHEIVRKTRKEIGYEGIYGPHKVYADKS